MSVVRIARLALQSKDRWARVEGESAVLLGGPPWDGGTPTGQVAPLSEGALLCPIAPSKIFGIGKNYRAHASEMGGEVPSEPLVFSKAVSSLVGPESTVLLPKESSRVDYEGELGVVIGSRCRRVSREEAMAHVYGYVPVCDVTARDLQKKDGQWTRAKGFDTFCPAGPFVVAGVDASALALSLTVNGETRQSASTADMVFGVAELVSHLSSFVTLLPGDLIATGTPEGVGPLAPGDTVEVTIATLGALRFRVEREG